MDRRSSEGEDEEIVIMPEIVYALNDDDESNSLRLNAFSVTCHEKGCDRNIGDAISIVIPEASAAADSEVLSTSKNCGKEESTICKDQAADAAKDEKPPVVIDVQFGGEVKGVKGTHEVEKICRICLMNGEDSAAVSETNGNSSGFIQLGCDCKNELGIAHTQCAEAWFRLRGNKMCEVCGEIAYNVTCVVERNEEKVVGSRRSLQEGGRECWRGHPFCNFLLACLVISFILPWFFRTNLF